MRRGDHVLHLHRLDHGHLLALAHRIAVGDVDGDDGALDRRGDADRAVGTGEVGRVVVDLRLRLLPPSPPRHARTAPADRCSCTLAPAKPAARGRGRCGLHEALPLLGRRRRASPCARRASACARSPATKSGCARMLRRKAMLVATPSSRNSLSARVSARHGVGEIRRRRMDDHLGQQGIERARGAVAGIAEPVGAHAGAVRRLVDGERAAAGPHRAVRPDRLHVDARLDRVAARRAMRRRGRGRGPSASRPAPDGSGSAPDRRR